MLKYILLEWNVWLLSNSDPSNGFLVARESKKFMLPFKGWQYMSIDGRVFNYSVKIDGK